MSRFSRRPGTGILDDDRVLLTWWQAHRRERLKINQLRSFAIQPTYEMQAALTRKRP